MHHRAIPHLFNSAECRVNARFCPPTPKHNQSAMQKTATEQMSETERGPSRKGSARALCSKIWESATFLSNDSRDLP